MKKTRNPIIETPFQIIFGTKEGESKGGHDNLSVDLLVSADSSGPNARIHFAIDSGSSVGQFDYDRKKVAQSLSLEEAKILKEKLEKFIKEGDEFMQRYNQT